MPLCFRVRRLRFLGDCYDFCTIRNSNEYSKVYYLINMLMTLKMRHITCNEMSLCLQLNAPSFED